MKVNVRCIIMEETGFDHNNMAGNNWDQGGQYDDDYEGPMDIQDDYGPPMPGPMRGPGGPHGRGLGGLYGGGPGGPSRGGPGGPYMGGGPDIPRNFRNARYSNAYGNYRGGYGPGGGFGPPPEYFDGPSFYNGPPPPLMGQGFGPNGPPMKKNNVEDKAMKYLIRCGVPKETLKNLPKRMLKMIDPEYCGLCALHFDSFAMSRMHYISKNHSKKQKAFLRNVEASAEIRRAKELPLKSRELYCELCDVQITSKQHADAHYAGKPHRSVVEGNRKPKNPILLQKGMESRIEQLVRREKRALKTLEKEEEQPNEEDKKVTTPPELYCEICKTCVTCTEQMTMHLNGKRHLTKEKQHILKMMRGDASGKKADKEEVGTENAADEEGDEEEKEEEEKTEEEKNTNDDWENNGEKWEDASIY